MAAGYPIQVFSQRSLPITLEGTVSVTVKVVGGGTVYYSTLGEYVTPSVNQGSIANGGSQTFTEQVWLRSATVSSVTLDYETPGATVTDESSTPRNIDSSGVADTNVLAYNAASGKFKAAAGGGGSTPGSVAVDQAPYNAAGDNSTDDTAALQAAINYVKVHGGTVWLGAGKTYKITSPLYLGNNTETFRITSAGGDAHINISYATIHLSGSSGGTGASGGAVQFNDPTSGQSAIGIELDHVRFTYDPNVFKGAGTYLVNVAPHSDGAGDVQPFDIHHCAFNATSPVNPSNGCASLLRLHQAIIGDIHHCHFGAAQEGIRLGDPGGSYVNSVSVWKNSFNYAQSAHIMVGSGDGESITIRENTFEDLPALGAIAGSSCGLYNPVIENNWFGDVSVDNANAAWISNLAVTSNNYVGRVAGNRCADVFADQYHLYLVGSWIVTQNSFEAGKAIYRSDSIGASSLCCIGNYYNNPAAVFDGSNGHSPPATYISLFNTVSGTPADPKTAANRIGPEVGYGTRNGGTIQNLGTGAEQLVVGVSGTNGAGLISGAIEALVYSDLNSITNGATELRLQAPTDSDSHQVSLVAGATPTRRVIANGTGIGFNGTTPIAPPVTNRGNLVAKLVAVGLLDATSADVTPSSQQSGASYTFALADNGTVVEGTSGSAQTFTVPPNSSVAFPIGTVISVFQNGAGQITIAPGAAVTLRSDGGKTKTAGQYATAGLRKRAADEWALSGDLST